MNCGEFAAIWPERYPRESALSNKQHRAMVRDWGERFADVPLSAVTRDQARAYGLEFPHRARYLRALYNDALRDGLVTENVFAALRLTPPRRELHFPSHEELQTLLRAAEEPLRSRIAFVAYTGLRRGEMLAVRPMDFETGGTTF